MEVVLSECVVGSVNSERFKTYMITLINICREWDMLDRTSFFMNNTSIHRSTIISDIINETVINVVWLSPYSYMLNPIEFGFSKIKNHVRGVLTNGYNGSFVDLIIESAARLNSEDLLGCFGHIRRNCARAVEMESFN
jgi:transposase